MSYQLISMRKPDLYQENIKEREGLSMKFAVLDDYVLSFNQWIKMEYGLVKKQFKMLCDTDKVRLRKEYEEYKKED